MVFTDNGGNVSIKGAFRKTSHKLTRLETSIVGEHQAPNATARPLCQLRVPCMTMMLQL